MVPTDDDSVEDADTLDFTASLNEPAPQEVTIDTATVDGNATSDANSLGQDFTAKSETITFNTGAQTKTFNVSLMDDTILEKDETFTVQLSNDPQYTTLADGTAVGTTVDDEENMEVSVSRGYDVVNEHHSGAVWFTVTLSHSTTTNHERAPAVAWRTVAGTATEGEDYRTGSGTVHLSRGRPRGSSTYTSPTTTGTRRALETFGVELVAADGRPVTLSSTESSYEVSIRDNETLTAAIAANSKHVVEGHDAVSTVKLKGGVTTADTKVTFGTGGDVQPGADYGTPIGNLSFPEGNSTGSSGTLTMPAGQSVGTITYPITGDVVVDDEEEMGVRLFSFFDGLRRAGCPRPSTRPPQPSLTQQGP